MNKYFKNLILYGDAEYYCVLCSEKFLSLALVERHLKWDGHRKKVKQLTYVGKYQKDFIRKIDSHFYCEACNIMISSVADAATHVTKESHRSNKNNSKPLKPSLVMRIDESSVRIGDSLLLNEEWNGIYDYWCIFCEQDVFDDDCHVGKEDHIIKLVQSKVKCVDGQFYRKFGDNLFFCFACKNTFTEIEFQIHFENEDHKFAKEHPEKSFFIRPRKPNPLLQKFQIDKTEDDEFEILQNNEDLSDEIEFEEVQSNEEILDKGQIRSELAKYGRKHYILLVNGYGVCYICDVMVPGHKSTFCAHINGKKHKEMILAYKMESVLKYCRLMPIRRWLKTLHFVNGFNFHADRDFKEEFVLNKTICVTVQSFLMISSGGLDGKAKKMKCHLCQMFIKVNDTKSHCMGEEHMNKLWRTEVVMDYEEDFIRFFHLHSYFCSYCEVIITGWKNLKSHINDITHQLRKQHQQGSTQKNITEPKYDWKGPNYIAHALNMALEPMTMLTARNNSVIMGVMTEAINDS